MKSVRPLVLVAPHLKKLPLRDVVSKWVTHSQESSKGSDMRGARLCQGSQCGEQGLYTSRSRSEVSPEVGHECYEHVRLQHFGLSFRQVVLTPPS